MLKLWAPVILALCLLNGSWVTASNKGSTTTAAARYRRDGPALLPDADQTPGDVLSVSASAVCRPGYSSQVRDVTVSEKHQVYREYAAQKKRGVCCEVDHLISLELGGSNSIKNLWPQPYSPKPGAHEKDKLENVLHKLVCQNRISLQEAQREISTDWYKAYQQRVLHKTSALLHGCMEATMPPMEVPCPPGLGGPQ